MSHHAARFLIPMAAPVVGFVVDALVIGGGAGCSNGRGNYCGGSGAGGYREFDNVPLAQGIYPVVVGSGSDSNSNGSNSSFNGQTSSGGGFGASDSHAASSGGSGGGAQSDTYSYGAGNTPSTTPVQGYRGGLSTNTDFYGSSAGGGALEVGGINYPDTIFYFGGKGGDGRVWKDGVRRAGGGGGYGKQNDPEGGSSLGGLGGGGRGAYFITYDGTSGAANTGSGSGANAFSSRPTIYGGSGVVIIRYLGLVQLATGGTITTSGGYTYHTFTGSGNFEVL